MGAVQPKLRFEPPTGELLPGRGFYQLEEDALYVQIAPFNRQRRFFSYLETPNVCLELDKEGRLLFIELDLARRHWTVDENLVPPERAEPAEVRWLDFREQIDPPKIVSNRRRLLVFLRFAARPAAGSYLIAENVILQAADDQTLVGIWVTDIVDDLAGREIAAFRKAVRNGTVA